MSELLVVGLCAGSFVAGVLVTLNNSLLMKTLVAKVLTEINAAATAVKKI